MTPLVPTPVCELAAHNLAHGLLTVFKFKSNMYICVLTSTRTGLRTSPRPNQVDLRREIYKSYRRTRKQCMAENAMQTIVVSCFDKNVQVDIFMVDGIVQVLGRVLTPVHSCDRLGCPHSSVLVG